MKMKLYTHARLILLLLLTACGRHPDQKKPVPPAVPPETKNAPSANTRPGKPPLAPLKNIVFFGNSLTAGYGVEPSQAFPALIQDRIDSLELPYKVINAGLSGETSAGGKSRIHWVLQQPVSVFVLELGGNDGLRGIPVPETYRNLQAIIDSVQHHYPAAKIVLAGMQMPPNMGNRYTTAFKDVYPRLAQKNHIALIPFLLQDVGGIPALNQPDEIHPNPEGHQIVAENVWKVLKAAL